MRTEFFLVLRALLPLDVEGRQQLFFCSSFFFPLTPLFVASAACSCCAAPLILLVARAGWGFRMKLTLCLARLTRPGCRAWTTLPPSRCWSSTRPLSRSRSPPSSPSGELTVVFDSRIGVDSPVVLVDEARSVGRGLHHYPLSSTSTIPLRLVVVVVVVLTLIVGSVLLPLLLLLLLLLRIFLLPSEICTNPSFLLWVRSLHVGIRPGLTALLYPVCELVVPRNIE